MLTHRVRDADRVVHRRVVTGRVVSQSDRTSAELTGPTRELAALVALERNDNGGDATNGYLADAAHGYLISGDVATPETRW